VIGLLRALAGLRRLRCTPHHLPLFTTWSQIMQSHRDTATPPNPTVGPPSHSSAFLTQVAIQSRSRRLCQRPGTTNQGRSEGSEFGMMGRCPGMRTWIGGTGRGSSRWLPIHLSTCPVCGHGQSLGPFPSPISMMPSKRFQMRVTNDGILSTLEPGAGVVGMLAILLHTP
jgi:hypothetical protein